MNTNKCQPWVDKGAKLMSLLSIKAHSYVNIEKIGRKLETHISIKKSSNT